MTIYVKCDVGHVSSLYDVEGEIGSWRSGENFWMQNLREKSTYFRNGSRKSRFYFNFTNPQKVLQFCPGFLLFRINVLTAFEPNAESIRTITKIFENHCSLVHTYDASISTRKSTCVPGQHKHKYKCKKKRRFPSSLRLRLCLRWHVLFLVLNYACVVRVNQPWGSKACFLPRFPWTEYILSIHSIPTLIRS